MKPQHLLLAASIAADAMFTAGGHRIIPPRVHAKATKKRKQQRASRKANR